jgi:hypothetical protein
MAVRKRIWKHGEALKEAWVVDFKDSIGRRRLKTFTTKRDADRFHGVTAAIGAGAIPEPLTRRYRPIEFACQMAECGGWKKGPGRQVLADALRAAHPDLRPVSHSVIVHVVAEMPPSFVVADVDNLLKPALDALKGIAWMDDTQVCELLIRRVPGRKRQLHIKIWQIPGPEVAAHLNALAEAGFASLRSA